MRHLGKSSKGWSESKKGDRWKRLRDMVILKILWFNRGLCSRGQRGDGLGDGFHLTCKDFISKPFYPPLDPSDDIYRSGSREG